MVKKLGNSLKELSDLNGVSGSEKNVRQYLLTALDDHHCSYQIDSIGNLLVRKGKKRHSGIMLSAHMDEVGLMVMAVRKSGLLRFQTVGGLDSRILPAKRVIIGPSEVVGVIGAKPIHLQKEGEQDKPFQLESLFIDCGFKSREEALRYIDIGQYAAFDVSCEHIGEGCFRGKAFDNRIGCLILLSLLVENNGLCFDAAFTVQEEVGTRGALTAAYSLQPEVALVVETTAAADTPETETDYSSTSLGAGPAISVMDGTILVDRQMRAELKMAAEVAGVEYQFRRFAGAGTEGGAIAFSRTGVKTAVVSVPCRYIHSPHSVVRENDINATINLVRAWLAARQ
jgi:tetrahedral aminopeptidase